MTPLLGILRTLIFIEVRGFRPEQCIDMPLFEHRVITRLEINILTNSIYKKCLLQNIFLPEAISWRLETSFWCEKTAEVEECALQGDAWVFSFSVHFSLLFDSMRR